MRKATVFVSGSCVTVLRNGRVGKDYDRVSDASMERLSALSYGEGCECSFVNGSVGPVVVMRVQVQE